LSLAVLAYSNAVFHLGPGRSAGYAIFNLRADYRPAPKPKFFAQINNRLDRRYDTAAQIGAAASTPKATSRRGRSLPMATAIGRPRTRPLLPAARRSFALGMKYTFAD
jgi:outer membrane receptor protein involved in Fe transport